MREQSIHPDARGSPTGRYESTIHRQCGADIMTNELFQWLDKDANAAGFFLFACVAFVGTTIIIYWTFDGIAKVIRALKGE